MNERLTYLWEQANIRYSVYETAKPREERKTIPDIFSQMIVRECARVAIAKQTENDIAGIVSKNSAKEFAYALIEHFGVE